MDQQLIDLCEKHDLTSVSVAVLRDGTVSVFTHWATPMFGDQCAYGRGASFTEALENALAEMSVERPIAA